MSSIANQPHIETIRYRMFLTIKCLRIAKNVNFNCKILWKRRNRGLKQTKQKPKPK